MAHSPVIFDDLNFLFRPYAQWLAYGQPKTANVLFAVAATQRWARDGIIEAEVIDRSAATPITSRDDSCVSPVAAALGVRSWTGGRRV
jgi:hypothetical protein